MALCDECCCFDDNHVDNEGLTEQQLENNINYEPNRYYYWHGDIQEDYQMPVGYDYYVRNVLETFSIVERYLKNILTMFISILHGMMRNMVGLYQFKKWHNRGDIPPQCAL